jgi:uncharacterized protein (TIGR02453 family)
VWPPEALEFLRELEENNDSEWFRANRPRYEAELMGPTRATAQRLSGFGEPHYFRPYNNLRYRPGPPLKEHIAVAFRQRPTGGFYLHLSLDGLMVAAGMFRPARDQLERFRAAISDGRRAKGFDRSVMTAERAGMSLVAPELKRAPRGYPQDHPRLDRLRLKRMTVSCRHPLEPWLHEPACDERIRAQLEACRPLVKWLDETVGPSELPARD